jgi:hypothetical protein
MLWTKKSLYWLPAEAFDLISINQKYDYLGTGERPFSNIANVNNETIIFFMFSS